MTGLIPAGFAEGDYVRAKRHDGTRAGGPQAPIYRLRPAIRWRFVDDVPETYEPGYLERVVVVSHHPYRRGQTFPFNEETVLGEGLIKVPMPIKAVPPATKRAARRR